MLLIRLLNACHHFPGFVYEGARLDEATKTIEIQVRPRRGSKPCCSGCSKSASGYDRLPERRFEFIPMWGFAVLLLYNMRRVQCDACGVKKVEDVPWAMGKHTLTQPVATEPDRLRATKPDRSRTRDTLYAGN